MEKQCLYLGVMGLRLHGKGYDNQTYKPPSIFGEMVICVLRMASGAGSGGGGVLKQ